MSGDDSRRPQPAARRRSGAGLGLVCVMLLAAVLAVLVSMLYVQDVLGDPVKTPSAM